MRGAIKNCVIQTFSISTGILFVCGILGVVSHLAGNDMVFPWYIPISIFANAVVTEVLTVIFLYKDNVSSKKYLIRIVLHMLSTYASVMFFGKLFKWYGTFKEGIGISVCFVFVYVFAWVVTIWMQKNDDRKINKALNSIRDEE